MRFELTEDQRDYARSLEDLLAKSGTAAASRAWGRGEAADGLSLWKRLADLGVTALCAPESSGGFGAGPVDVVVAFESLGRHLVPGPYIESVTLVPTLLASLEDFGGIDLTRIAIGDEIVTIAAPPGTPYALDADVAHRTLFLDGSRLTQATVHSLHRSVDSSRRLYSVTGGDDVGGPGCAVIDRGLNLATLACSAQLLGLGEHLLSASVDYAKSRKQFGRQIGEFQALKHALADVRVALDFARPLVYFAALSMSDESGKTGRDVSAAKVAAGDAAYRASRAALQVHGAIGYTEELDLGLWITKVRALYAAWGTPGHHRARVLESLTASAG